MHGHRHRSVGFLSVRLKPARVLAGGVEGHHFAAAGVSHVHRPGPVNGYVILRGLTKDSLEQVAEVGLGVTTWSEDGLERGTTYYYSVAAKNDVGEGEPILAREVKVEKKAVESPGFEVLVVVTAMMLVIPMIRRRG